MYQNIFIDSDFKREKHKVYLWDDKAGLVVSEYKPYAYKKNNEGKYTSIFGDKLDKVYGGFSYGENGYFESDVPAITRVLIDCYGDSDEISTNHRILFFDIETETEGGYPKIDTANQPITAIAVYDFNVKKYICFVLDKDGTNSDFSYENREVRTFLKEEDLLEAFLDKYKDLNPTILSGWNVVGFDVPYIINRISRVLGEKAALRLSPICIIRKDEIRGTITIAGVSILDYLDLYKKFTVGVVRLPNYRLDTVAYHELKEEKLKYEGSLGRLLKTDFKKFVEYNIRDVYLVVGIDNKNKFIELAMALAHVGHIRYEDFSVSSRLLEGALLTYLRRNNLVAPNKPKPEEQRQSMYVTEDEFKVLDENGEEIQEDLDEDDDKGFEGAYVKEPIPGRYDWIFSCDINSLYPSTIMSLNISPETLIGQTKEWSSKKFAQGQLSTVTFKNFLNDSDTTISKEEFNKFLVDNNYCVASNGAVYNQSKDGLLKNILSKWYAERVEYKKKAKEASDAKDSKIEMFYNLRQMVQKILLNSLYGVLGLGSFRFYDLINAEAVTISGQNIIKTTADYVNNVYNKKVGTSGVDYVTYVDTDSNYISAKPLMIHEGVNPNDHVAAKQFTIDTAKFFGSSINKFYDVMMPKLFFATSHRIKIAEDVIASSALWIAKKRYAMLKVYDMEKRKDLDYKLDAKGIDIVRTSFPVKFKDLMERVIKEILTHTPKDKVDQTILDFKKSMDGLKTTDICKNAPAKFSSEPTKKRPYKLEYLTSDRNPFKFIKGTTVNSKAAIAYNDMLIAMEKQDLVEPIYEGAKIKWVYMKKNPYGLEQMGFKADGTDPKEIIEFIELFIDRKKIFDKELFKKLSALYEALGWELFQENKKKAEEFFIFEE